MTAGDVIPRPRTAAASTSGFLSSQKQQECVKVIVRSRPLSTMEISQGHQSIVNMHTDRGLIELHNPLQTSEPSKDFTFDAIYNESSRQQELYDETFRELVDSVLDGFNGTIFAYGQTGTGKTYTMEGRVNLAEERGVIYNCFEHIFNHIAQSRNQQYLIRASYLEIYQEEIRDLLNKDSKQRLELKERPDGGVYVKDLVSYMTISVGEIQNVMAVGNANRSTGRTNMNEHSSRSHAIFIITIECSETDASGESHIRMGRLNLVDLAGSERQAKTGATGERFKEATKINLSLSALGNVISALVDGKSTHIPYRDSKLTRLLQDSLGGNSKTVMVACIGPASYNFEETLGTLRYANRAKNIKNKPKINEDPKDAMLRQYQDEISRLRSMLEKRKGRKDYDENRGDEYYKEQRRSLEADKQKVLRDDSLVKEERKRIMAQLEEREKQLEREKAAQTMMTEKIAIMESKLLGGTDLIGQTKKQQDELQKRRKELAEQKKREREILEQLEQHEDDTAEIHQTFTSLQQELEAKNRKLYKFKLKLKKIRSELNDSERLHHQEREGLQRDVAELNKELKLKLLIVDNFIPPDVHDRVKDRAVWSENDNTWQIPGARPLSSGTRPSTSTGDPGNFLIVEDQGLLTHSTGADSGVGLGEASTSSGHRPTPDFLDKRPTSIPGLRRPMSANERMMVDRAREQLSRQMRPLITGNAAVEPILNEDIIRYCGENVLVFSGLERHTSEVVDFETVVISFKKRARPQRHPHSQSRPSHISEIKRTRRKILGTLRNNEEPLVYLIHIPYPLQFKPNETIIETFKPQPVFNNRTSIKEVFLATLRFGLTSETASHGIKQSVEQILFPPTDVQFTCASSESSESEGTCADYVSKGAASMSSSFFEEELNLCGRLPPQFGRIVNLDQSIDIRSLVQTDCRRSLSFPRTSTPIVMASSCYDMPCTPRRPTRIPQLMSKSVSIGSPNARARLIREGSSVSAPIEGSCEQLCDDFVDVRSEAKRLLERSRRRTPMRAATYEQRCAFPENGRMSLSTRRINMSFSASPSRRQLIHRPQISRTGEEIVEKASIELSMLRSQIQTRFEAPRCKSAEPIETVNRKRRRMRNCYGGILPYTMERLIRWYRVTRTICQECRNHQRLHRLSSHSVKPKTIAPGVSKQGVILRSRCVCEELKTRTVHPYTKPPLRDGPLFSDNTQKLIDLGSLFAAIAFLLNLLLKLLF